MSERRECLSASVSCLYRDGIGIRPSARDHRTCQRRAGAYPLVASSDDLVSEIAIDHGSTSEGYLSLSAILALAKLGIRQNEIMPAEVGSYRIGPLQIPTVGQDKMRINYAGDVEAFTHISYQDIAALDWEDKLRGIKGKIVLIGVTAKDHMADYQVPVRGPRSND